MAMRGQDIAAPGWRTGLQGTGPDEYRSGGMATGEARTGAALAGGR